MGWSWSRWGVMEEGGGLLDQPIGLVDKVTVVLNVHDAWRAFAAAGDSIVDWAESRPAQMKIVSVVQRMRMEQNGSA